MANGHINAHHALALLVQNGIQRNGGFAGLAVADDQLTLAAADGKHRVDGEQAGFHGLIHGLAVNNAGSRCFNGIIVLALNGGAAVHGFAQSVDHTPQEGPAHRHACHLAGAAHGAALHDVGIIAKDHAADLLLFQIEDHAL